MEIFRSMYMVFASFSGVLDWIVLILVWFERSLHSAQVSGQSCPWPLKLMTSQRVERTWICTGGYGRFRGEWVNDDTILLSYFYQDLYYHFYNNCTISRVLIGGQLCSIRVKNRPWKRCDGEDAIFLFLAFTVFQGISIEMDIKIVNVIVKTKQQQFSIVCTLIDQ